VTPPIVVIHRDTEVLAGAVAARLITRLVDVQAARGVASLVLTGGRVAASSLKAIADSPARAAIDWA
jgi:6-phosphogluconolactonase